MSYSTRFENGYHSQNSSRSTKSKIKENHFLEWKNSAVSQEIIELNVKSLEGNAVYECLCYGIDRSERLNSGRLSDKHLNRYKLASEGGWHCAGIDLITFKDSEWGCFKADKPRKHEGKAIKYESPCEVPTEVFALKIPDSLWKDISKSSGFPIGTYMNFWEWVVNNPLPVIITEGAKKAGCLLSCGFIAVALPGVDNGFRDGEIHPQLKALCQVKREFIFCYDQDQKWQTKLHITKAIKKLGKALEDADSEVSVVIWDKENDGEGKGIDDFVIKNPGIDRLNAIYDDRLTLEKYLEKFDQVKKLDKQNLLMFFEGTFGKRLAYNELTTRIELDGEPIKLSGQLVFQLIKEHNIEASEDAIVNGMQYVAAQNSYHPVAKYLESTFYLPDANIEDLANRYLGIPLDDPNSDLYNTFVKKFLLAAVARIFEPGCEFHHALILQASTHGIGKSTFFKVLAGKWHDSSATSDIESRQTKMVFHKCWFQEWDEFEKITNARTAGEVKSFVTNPKDNFVPPYGREAIDHPRRFVICGTVNNLEFLIDETGNRRFLVIPIPNGWFIPNDKLALERDRIWGTVLRLYLDFKKHGLKPWVLTHEEEKTTTEANQQFLVHDEWQNQIEEWLRGREKVTVIEIMEKLFFLDAKDQTPLTQKRIVRLLKIIGWRYNPQRKKDPDTGKAVRYWYPSVF